MRTFLTLILLLFTTLSFAGPVQRSHISAIAGMGNGASESSETYIFKYDVDHSSGDDYAYINSGASSNQGTFNSTSASSSQNHTSGGTYSLQHTGTSDRIDFSISTLNTSEGSLEMWVYIDAADISDGGMDLFEISVSGGEAANMMRAQIDTDGHIYFRHEGNNAVVSFTTTGTVGPFQAWQRLRFRWSVTNDLTGVQIASASWENDADATEVTAFSVTQDNLVIGDGAYNTQSSTASQYIDDFSVMSGYNTFND